MTIRKQATWKNCPWATEKLIGLSKNLGQAYYFGLDSTESGKKADTWTTDKFIAMSKNLSSAYGVDY